jgi:hypothetical protein
MTKKIRLFISTAALVCAAALFVTGCANGRWNTGSATANAALTQAQTELAVQVAGVANEVANGSDIKTALVQASGDAVRSLEATGIAAIQPAIQEQVSKWVPHTPQWQAYAHALGSAVAAYVANHQNTPHVLDVALEAAATTLNNF